MGGRNKHTVEVSATLQEALDLIRHDVLNLLSLHKEPHLSQGTRHLEGLIASGKVSNQAGMNFLNELSWQEQQGREQRGRRKVTLQHQSSHQPPRSVDTSVCSASLQETPLRIHTLRGASSVCVSCRPILLSICEAEVVMERETERGDKRRLFFRRALNNHLEHGRAI